MKQCQTKNWIQTTRWATIRIYYSRSRIFEHTTVVTFIPAYSNTYLSIHSPSSSYYAGLHNTEYIDIVPLHSCCLCTSIIVNRVLQDDALCVYLIPGFVLSWSDDRRSTVIGNLTTTVQLQTRHVMTWFYCRHYYCVHPKMGVDTFWNEENRKQLQIFWFEKWKSRCFDPKLKTHNFWMFISTEMISMDPPWFLR